MDFRLPRLKEVGATALGLFILAAAQMGLPQKAQAGLFDRGSANIMAQYKKNAKEISKRLGGAKIAFIDLAETEGFVQSNDLEGLTSWLEKKFKGSQVNIKKIAEGLGLSPGLGQDETIKLSQELAKQIMLRQAAMFLSMNQEEGLVIAGASMDITASYGGKTKVIKFDSTTGSPHEYGHAVSRFHPELFKIEEYMPRPILHYHYGEARSDALAAMEHAQDGEIGKIEELAQNRAAQFLWGAEIASTASTDLLKAAAIEQMSYNTTRVLDAVLNFHELVKNKNWPEVEGVVLSSLKNFYGPKAADLEINKKADSIQRALMRGGLKGLSDEQLEILAMGIGNKEGLKPDEREALVRYYDAMSGHSGKLFSPTDVARMASDQAQNSEVGLAAEGIAGLIGLYHPGPMTDDQRAFLKGAIDLVYKKVGVQASEFSAYVSPAPQLDGAGAEARPQGKVNRAKGPKPGQGS